MKITEAFERGEFVVTAEVGPPKGFHIEHMLEEAKTYLSGITAVNVTDNQSSVMRLGSLATCKALKDEGLTPIFQMTCRDRNRIALESDLLSAALFGIENLLLLTGDHTKLGDHPQAKPVFDLDSVSLIHAVKQLESGVDLGGMSWLESRRSLPRERLYHPAAILWTFSLRRWSARLPQERNISRPRRFMSRRSSSNLWRRQSSSASRYSLES